MPSADFTIADLPDGLIDRIYDALPKHGLEQDGYYSLTAIRTILAAGKYGVLYDALEAIKELADADETFLCWKTANDALEQVSA